MSACTAGTASGHEQGRIGAARGGTLFEGVDDDGGRTRDRGGDERECVDDEGEESDAGHCGSEGASCGGLGVNDCLRWSFYTDE